MSPHYPLHAPAQAPCTSVPRVLCWAPRAPLQDAPFVIHALSPIMPPAGSDCRASQPVTGPLAPSTWPGIVGAQHRPTQKPPTPAFASQVTNPSAVAWPVTT